MHYAVYKVVSMILFYLILLFSSPGAFANSEYFVGIHYCFFSAMFPRFTSLLYENLIEISS